MERTKTDELLEALLAFSGSMKRLASLLVDEELTEDELLAAVRVIRAEVRASSPRH